LGPAAQARALNGLCGARLAYGAGLLLTSPEVLSALSRVRLRRSDVLVARLLGVRHLLQAAALGRRPDRAALRIGAGVDAVHAASMLAAARMSRRRRNRWLAARNARSAAALALVGVYASQACADSAGGGAPGDELLSQ
jgi:hypothetical protein